VRLALAEALAGTDPVLGCTRHGKCRTRLSTQRLWADSICYRVTGDCVEVMAIIGQQDLDDWL
jgi:hypothetical protein